MTPKLDSHQNKLTMSEVAPAIGSNRLVKWQRKKKVLELYETPKYNSILGEAVIQKNIKKKKW